MKHFAGQPRTDLEVIERGYEHFNRGDLDWVIAHLAPSVVWEDARQMPDARTYRGLDDVRRFLTSFERHWEEIRFELEDIQAGGGTVIAFVHLVGRGKASGAEVDAHLFHVWEMRDLMVTRIRTFFDREEAERAAGSVGESVERAGGGR
jgi:ketosteroid isomerase-like protein